MLDKTRRSHTHDVFTPEVFVPSKLNSQNSSHNLNIKTFVPQGKRRNCLYIHPCYHEKIPAHTEKPRHHLAAPLVLTFTQLI